MLGVAFVFCYAVTFYEIVRYGNLGKSYGFSAQGEGWNMRVTEVLPHREAEGRLKVGDLIVAVNGNERMAAPLKSRFLLATPAGGTYVLRVRRGDAVMDITMPVGRVAVPFWWGYPMYMLAALASLGVGLLMGLSKPSDRTVQFGCCTFLAFAALHLSKPLGALYWIPLDGVGRTVLGFIGVFDPLQAGVGYLFAARFPVSENRPRWMRVLGAVICVSIGLEWLRRLPLVWFNALPMDQGVAYFIRHADFLLFLLKKPNWTWKAHAALVLLAAGVALVSNYRRLKQPDQRRRLRWVMFGIVVALAPAFVLYVAVTSQTTTGFGVSMQASWFHVVESILDASMGIVLAITLGYAVLRHRVLDIHVVVRRSLQYLFARRVLQAAVFLPVVVLAARAILNPGLSVRDLLFGSYFYVGVMGVAAVGLAYRRPLLAALDRRFFREAYNQEQILRTLIEEIREHDSIGEISRLVSSQVEAAFHPSCVLVFYRRQTDGDYVLGHSSSGDAMELRVPAGSTVLRQFDDGASLVSWPPDDEPSAEGDASFDKLGIRLMAAVRGTDRRLVGIVMLGEKRSEEPYTAGDKSLLQAIASQIGVVYENVALREAAKREMQIKRNVLAHLENSAVNLLKECPVCHACYDRGAETCASDGAELALTLPVERVVDGVYRLDRRIGVGGMGAVYRATDLRLSRAVAVKVMIGSLFGNQAALRRFEREARTAARLSHPNIVAIYDLGTIGEDGAYLVMELVEGITFRSLQQNCGAMAPPVAAARFGQILDGLAAAHAAGVVHRDLKPANVILSQLADGAELVKILDFGLAKFIDGAGDGTSLTLPGSVLGTLGYMSPEQLLGQDVDERGDTFSAAVMLVEALTGTRPFSGATFQELVHSTMHAEYHLPGEGAAVARLDAVLQRCLARDRAARPTVAQIRTELIEAVRRCPALGGSSSVDVEASTLDESRT